MFGPMQSDKRNELAPGIRCTKP